MPNQPTNPSRHNFFSRLGAIIKGAFAHGRVVDPEDLPVVQVDDITELTVDGDSNLRVVDAGSADIVADLDAIRVATETVAAEVTVNMGLEVNQPTAADLNMTEASAADIKAAVQKLATETTVGSGIAVNQGDASKLKNTELNSASIKTAVELIDDVVATLDAAAPTKGALMAGKASAGVPAAMHDGDAVPIRTDLTGSQGVHLTAGTDYTNSSMTTREVSATGLSQGSQAISNAAATALNAGVSLACVRVHVRATVTNTDRINIGGSGVLATTGIRLYPGDSISLEIDDVAKVSGFAQVLNETLSWVAETR